MPWKKGKSSKSQLLEKFALVTAIFYSNDVIQPRTYEMYLGLQINTITRKEKTHDMYMDDVQVLV